LASGPLLGKSKPVSYSNAVIPRLFLDVRYEEKYPDVKDCEY
jgi:hypothetical protein